MCTALRAEQLLHLRQCCKAPTQRTLSTQEHSSRALYTSMYYYRSVQQHRPQSGDAGHPGDMYRTCQQCGVMAYPESWSPSREGIPSVDVVGSVFSKTHVTWDCAPGFPGVIVALAKISDMLADSSSTCCSRAASSSRLPGHPMPLWRCWRR